MAFEVSRSVLFEALRGHDQGSAAIADTAAGKHFTYASLMRDVSNFKRQLLRELGRNDISGERVAFIVENGYNYVGQRLLIGQSITKYIC
jgi:malonyl-CoA/methylmalonyl-CoA synthetase